MPVIALAAVAIGAAVLAVKAKGENTSKIINDVMIRNLTDASINFKNETMRVVNTSVTGMNELNQNFRGADFTACVIKNNQTINVVYREVSEFTQDLRVNFERDIKNAIEVALDNSISQVNEKLNLNQENNSITQTTVVQENITDLSQAYTNAYSEFVNTRISGNNLINQNFEGAVLDCTKGGGVFNIQDIYLDADITRITENQTVIDSITKLTNETIMTIENTTTQRNTGVDPLSFTGLLAALGALLALIPLLIAFKMAKKFFPRLGGGSKSKVYVKVSPANQTFAPKKKKRFL